MNSDDSPEQARFRGEVRECVATAVPDASKGRRLGIVAGLGPSPESMIFKLHGGDPPQRVLGPAGALQDGAPFPPEVVEAGQHAAHIRHLTIGGGTSEIHRTVIAKRVPGLPD